MNIKKYLNDNKDIIGVYIDNKLLIKNGTTLGYMEAEEGDGIDLAYIAQNKRRGRVQKQVSGTLTCSASRAVVVYE